MNHRPVHCYPRQLHLGLILIFNRKLYGKLDYSVDDLKDAVGGVDIGLSDDKVTLLMGRMREPCLSIHGVQGGSSDDSSKTVIPRSVTGKFSLRYVRIPFSLEQ